MSSHPRWPQVVAGSCLVLDASLAGGFHDPLRVIFALWFFLTCPGLSFVPLLGLGSATADLLFVVMASLAIDTVVATAVVLVGDLTTVVGLIALELVCLVGCAAQLLSSRRELRAGR
jgi:hypothetical protein